MINEQGEATSRVEQESVDVRPDEELSLDGVFELRTGEVMLGLAKIVDQKTASGVLDLFSVNLSVREPGGEPFNAIASYNPDEQVRGKYVFSVTGADNDGKEVKREIVITDGVWEKNGPKGTVLECD